MGFTNMKGMGSSGSASMVSASMSWGPVLCVGESCAAVS